MDLDAEELLSDAERELIDLEMEFDSISHAFSLAGEKLDAVRTYCSDTLDATEDFPNWNMIIRKLMRDILKILDGPSCSEEATE